MIVRCWMEGGVPQPCEHFFATHFVFQKSSVSHWKGLAQRDRYALREKHSVQEEIGQHCLLVTISAKQSISCVPLIARSVLTSICDMWPLPILIALLSSRQGVVITSAEVHGQHVFKMFFVMWCSCLPLITALPGNPQSQLVSHSSSLCGSDLQSF